MIDNGPSVRMASYEEHVLLEQFESLSFRERRRGIGLVHVKLAQNACVDHGLEVLLEEINCRFKMRSVEEGPAYV